MPIPRAFYEPVTAPAPRDTSSTSFGTDAYVPAIIIPIVFVCLIITLIVISVIVRRRRYRSATRNYGKGSVGGWQVGAGAGAAAAVGGGDASGWAVQQGQNQNQMNAVPAPPPAAAMGA